ncbi:uncharacterized protein EAF02_011948 [Botrytis sinoallii]|uniref:uncharacterized protein n=1 Tax=Botrytis sinoallii TaxID=1463999 RepID=UPI001902B5D1|nr:uncharacterized protein EAF02_011948 [Botrytis sinoallii]KAF7853294.1 hypothetical protein EAF02_011948 [Botrytis sinoallii]
MSSDHGMGLINRERIWKLGIEMVSRMQAIQEPGRFLHGDIVTDVPSQRLCSIVSCLALKRDLKGCKQVTQRSMHWGKMHVESQLCTVTPLYVDILERRVVSGLTFTFSHSQPMNIDYILVASSLGIEPVGIDIYPHSFLDSIDELGVSKWSLEHLTRIFVGLDALRIVKIWPNLKKN